MNLAEIAKMLGCSVCTVSMALNDSPRVKKETREKIKKFAALVNYTPSAMARGLVTKKTRIVGIMNPTISAPYHGRVAEEIQKRLIKQNYIGLAVTAYTLEEQIRTLNTFFRYRVDGIISGKMYPEIFLAVKNENIPLVIYDWKTNNRVDSVVGDRCKGGRIAAEHLVKLGYRRIGFVCAPGEESMRLQGFRAVLHEHLIPLRAEWVGQGMGYYQDGYEVMKKMLALAERPRAVVCYNDVAAFGAMRAISEAGLKIPDDMGMVGFDNIEESAYGYVPLTTVDQPVGEISGKSVELLLRRLDNPLNTSFKKIVVSVKLVIRDSCGWKKQAG